jgi:hypothetical protein
MLTTDQKGAVAEIAIALIATKLGIDVYRPLHEGGRYDRNGLLRRIYVEGEVDGYAAYCQEIDRCFFLPYENFVRRTQIHLRLDRTNNNQKLGINWADDFDFAAKLGNEQGAVAQLGERRHGMPKATGSSPVGSTLFA